jgi:prepilin-type N-terminal cleavage/methylation domain-containing protein
MKKSFTLIEMLISIAIFSIILLFLYSLIDREQKSRDTIQKELLSAYDSNNFKSIIFKDIIESSCSFSLNKKQNMLTIDKTSNALHNPFYTQTRYLFTKNKKLLRIESKPYTAKDGARFADILEESYIDTVLDNIDKFEILIYGVSGGIAFYIKHGNKSDTFKVKC